MKTEKPKKRVNNKPSVKRTLNKFVDAVVTEDGDKKGWTAVYRYDRRRPRPTGTGKTWQKAFLNLVEHEKPRQEEKTTVRPKRCATRKAS